MRARRAHAARIASSAERRARGDSAGVACARDGQRSFTSRSIQARSFGRQPANLLSKDPRFLCPAVEFWLSNTVPRVSNFKKLREIRGVSMCPIPHVDLFEPLRPSFSHVNGESASRRTNGRALEVTSQVSAVGVRGRSEPCGRSGYRVPNRYRLRRHHSASLRCCARR